jgi:hypothetical protein
MDPVDTLILDLLEWVATHDRTYQDVMDVWRTSCPRFPIWEDAVDRGLVLTERRSGCSIVRVTSSGLALLMQRRPSFKLCSKGANQGELKPISRQRLLPS